MPAVLTPGENQHITKRAKADTKAGGPPSEKSAMGSAVYQVVASDYSGSGGGSCGNLQDGQLHYAELSSNTPSASGAGDNFSAMGNLPCGTALQITYKGKTVTATKADVGGGGAGIGGIPRVIDLYMPTAQALGFSGLGVVTIQRPDGLALNLPPGAKAGKGGVNKNEPPPDINLPNPLSALGDVAKVISFIFSLQFLYVIAGGVLVILALIFLFSSTKTGGPIVKKGAEAAGAAALL